MTLLAEQYHQSRVTPLRGEGVTTRWRLRTRLALGALTATCLGASPGGAQDAPVRFPAEPRAGACEVVLAVSSQAVGHDVGVRVAQTVYRAQRVAAATPELRFRLADPLRAGDPLVAEVDGARAAQSVAVEANGGSPAPCKPVDTPHATDEPFDASVYFGYVFDNFAPDNVGDYKNPGAGKPKYQHIYGFGFNYHLWKRLHLYGETMHGVRSADIDCTGPVAERPPVCADVTDPKYADRARYILEHATSLEAFINPRWELGTLNPETDSEAQFYVGAKVGLHALSGAPSVFRTWGGALGLLMKNGGFEGSFLEFGLGHNELLRGTTRFQADALLSFGTDAVLLLRGNARFFAQATIDNDLRNGPDAFRTFWGIDLSPSWLSGR